MRQVRLTAAALALAVPLLAGCPVSRVFPDDDDDDPAAYEGDEPGECSDEADNDQDGLFDCDDPGCSGSPSCDDDDDDDDAGDDDQGDDDQGDDDDTTDCPDDEIEDCMGNCAPSSWLGDGLCDDRVRQHDSVIIDLDCEELDFDDGDCSGDDDDDDLADDDDATPGVPCFDEVMSCPAGLPDAGTADSLEAGVFSTAMTLDPVSGWACSDPLYFQIPADATGWYFASVGAAVLSDVDAPSGPVVDLVLPDVSGLAPADAEAAYIAAVADLSSTSSDPPVDMGLSLNPQLFRFALSWPTSPTSHTETGCHAVRLVGPAALAGVAHPYVFGIRRGADAGARLDVHVVRSSSVSEAQALDALAYAETLVAAAGVQLGEVTFEDLDPAYEMVDLTVGDHNAMWAAGGGSPSSASEVVVYLVSSILSSSGQTIGLSSAIPGDVGTSGPFSGVLVSTSSGNRIGTLMGQTIAHEVGHQLGLRHTSEASGLAHDLLSDTPECPASADLDGDNQLQPTECLGMGAENVMFWQAYEAAVEITDQQADVFTAILPGPELACVDHSTCTDYEICAPSGFCELAYGRPYSIFVDGVAVASSGPSGSWDGLGGAPDPFAQWSVFWAGDSFTSTTPTVQDDYVAWWYESAVGIPVDAATSWLGVLLYDEDLSSDDLIDALILGPPIPVSDLRSSYLSVPLTYSTLEIGFLPE